VLAITIQWFRFNCVRTKKQLEINVVNMHSCTVLFYDLPTYHTRQMLCTTHIISCNIIIRAGNAPIGKVCACLKYSTQQSWYLSLRERFTKMSDCVLSSILHNIICLVCVTIEIIDGFMLIPYNMVIYIIRTWYYPVRIDHTVLHRLRISGDQNIRMIRLLLQL
jgi:hypothetical protein